MPFWSMVRFMVKWAIASIPALLILSLVGVVVIALLAGGGGLVGAALLGRRDGKALHTPAVAPTPNDPAGIMGSSKVYLDGPQMQFHEPGCPAVGALKAPMQYERADAAANGYMPHACVTSP